MVSKERVQALPRREAFSGLGNGQAYCFQSNPYKAETIRASFKKWVKAVGVAHEITRKNDWEILDKPARN